MEPMSSPSLYAGFERLHARRGLLPDDRGMGMQTLWHRPSNADWAVGDTILHLRKTMRIYRQLTSLSSPGLFPVAGCYEIARSTETPFTYSLNTRQPENA